MWTVDRDAMLLPAEDLLLSVYLMMLSCYVGLLYSVESVDLLNFVFPRGCTS